MILENIISKLDVYNQIIVKIWYNSNKGDSLIYDIRLSFFLKRKPGE